MGVANDPPEGGRAHLRVGSGKNMQGINFTGDGGMGATYYCRWFDSSEREKMGAGTPGNQKYLSSFHANMFTCSHVSLHASWCKTYFHACLQSCLHAFVFLCMHTGVKICFGAWHWGRGGAHGRIASLRRGQEWRIISLWEGGGP